MELSNHLFSNKFFFNQRTYSTYIHHTSWQTWNQRSAGMKTLFHDGNCKVYSHPRLFSLLSMYLKDIASVASLCKNLLLSIMYFTWWRGNLYFTANDITRFYFFLDTDCQSKGWGLSTSTAYTQVFMVHRMLSTDANWHWRC